MLLATSRKKSTMATGEADYDCDSVEPLPAKMSKDRVPESCISGVKSASVSQSFMLANEMLSYFRFNTNV